MVDLHVGNHSKRISSAELRQITKSNVEQALLDFQNGDPHSFGESVGYDLIYDGKRFPPKAILGLAAKYAIGRVLKPDDFTGGEDSTCFRVLRGLGFEIGPKLEPIFRFKVGEQYSRSEDIHKPFGGQMRGGICTPQSVPAVFLFTGKSGDQFGYVDDWNEEHTIYSFAGEGQEGDMEMKGGNRAIGEHEENGKEIHLFEALGKGKPIRYMGRFVCIDHRTGQGIDKNGAARLVLIFDLVPYGAILPTADLCLLDRLTKRLATKPFTHPPAGQQVPEKVIQSAGVAYKRDPEVRAYVLHLAEGHCELCAEPAPFVDTSGTPFLEVHHVIQLAHKGADTPANAVALCPNCHRLLHHSADASEAIQKLYKAQPRLKSPFN